MPTVTGFRQHEDVPQKTAASSRVAAAAYALVSPERGSAKPGRRWLFAFAALALCLYGVQFLASSTGVFSADASTTIAEWTYVALTSGSAVAVLLRAALIADQRRVWLPIGVGLAAWALGDIYWTAVLAHAESIPYPSLSDGLYLLAYPFWFLGLIRLGGRIRSSEATSLAALVALLGLASVWSWLVFQGVLETSEGSTAAIATNLTYPLADLMLLGAALLAAAARGWRIDRVLGALIVGLVILAIADLIYLAQVASDSYVSGSMLDLLWSAATVSIAVAAWIPTPRSANSAETGVEGTRVIPGVAVVASVIGIMILVWDHFEEVSHQTLALAALTLVAAIVQVVELSRARDRANERARDAEQLHSASLEAATDAVITVDGGGRVLDWNRVAEQTFGHERSDVIGRDVVSLLIGPEKRAERREELVRLLAEDRLNGQHREVIATDAWGRRFPVDVTLGRIQDEPPIYAAFIHDISGRRAREVENERLASIVRSSHDAIISADLDTVVTSWNQGATRLFGFSADEAVGEPLTRLIVPADRVDEPGALIAEVVAKGFAEIETKRVSKDGRTLDVSLRCFPMRDANGEMVGVSVIIHDQTDTLRRKDQTRRDIETHTWHRRIEDALAKDGFRFYGQPVVDAQTGSLHHRELLIRMELDGRTILPGKFLPHAERSDLINAIDRWAIGQAAEFGAEDPVAVNLSAKSLANPRLVDLVRSSLRSSGTPSGRLIFEITETAVAANLEAARRLVEALRTLGCAVALDDFGTGYGSFTYLKYLPVSEIKIDMSFVQGMTRNEADERVVGSIVQIAGNFGMRTVAEGVEDAATAMALRAMGVDYLQGYHLGRPEPMDRIEAHPEAPRLRNEPPLNSRREPATEDQ